MTPVYFIITYHKTKVRNDNGIPTPRIRLQNFGSNRCAEAIIAAVAIGPMADSKKEISIISPLCFKTRKYKMKITAGNKMSLNKSPQNKGFES